MAFIKAPYMNVELHYQLFGGQHKISSQYYAHVWDKAIEDSARPGCFWLKPDDEYIYQMAHFYKHYVKSKGSGIRSILDIAMFRRKYTLNETYVQKEFETLGIADVAACAQSLASRWFGSQEQTPAVNEPTAEEQKMALLLLYGGTYGNVESMILRDVHLDNDTICARIRLAWKRAFIPLPILAGVYPTLKKYPVLYPVCSVHRLITKRKDAGSELAKILSQ